MITKRNFFLKKAIVLLALLIFTVSCSSNVAKTKPIKPGDDFDLIAKKIKASVGGIAYCVNNYYGVQDTTLRVEFGINPEGNVTKVRMVSRHRVKSGLTTCFAKVLKKISFPKTRSRLTVK